MKFLHDVIYKGSLTAEGNVQLGDSRLDVHNVYGALVVGNGGTGTDITALTVKAMGTGASANFQTLDVNGAQVFATLENGYLLLGGTVRPTDNKTGFIFDAFVVSPVAFQITSRSNNTSGLYKGLVVTEGNLNGINGGSFDTRYVEVSPTINATGGVEFALRGFYYNPTITNLTATSVSHIAWENTVGDIIHGNLSGTGTRMVVADSTGKLTTQTIPSFSESDTLDSVTDRNATTTNSITVGGLSVVSAASGVVLNSVAGGGGSWNLASYSTTNAISNAVGFYSITSDTTPLVITPSKLQVKNVYELIWGFDDAGYADAGTPNVGIAWEAANTLKITNGSTGYGGLKLNDLKVTTLVGSGTRMVVADANGLLSTQAIPTGGTGSSTLSGLTDVNLTSPSNNQLLKYDSTSSKWINWTPNYLTSYTEIYQGTVTSVSVVSANGFAGTVATDTTTPAITLSTTVTGLLKGNGTSVSAATASTDYLVPSDLSGYLTTSTAASTYQPLDGDLTAIAALSGTSGLLKKTAADTWSLDTNVYLTANQSITLSGAVTGSGTTAITTTLANSVVGISNLSATGTPSASTYLRGDNTWAAVSSGSNIYTDNGTLTANRTLSGADLYGLTFGSLNFFAVNPTTGKGSFIVQPDGVRMKASSSGNIQSFVRVVDSGTDDPFIEMSSAFSNTYRHGLSITKNSISIAGVLDTNSTVFYVPFLPNSSTSNVLYYNTTNGQLSYGAAPGGSGYTVTSQTANYTETVTTGTKIIKGDTTGGTFTITLPTAVGNQALLIIKKTAGTANLVIDGAGTETIDGGLTATLVKENESITLISDNANWQIV